jgi:mRNA interferase YafQ
MREIVRQSAFKRDYKREKKGRYGAALDNRLQEVLEHLVRDVAPPDNFKDHRMSGLWADCRNCHVWPDLLLLYRKPKDETLELVRLGSHSELFK